MALPALGSGKMMKGIISRDDPSSDMLAQKIKFLSLIQGTQEDLASAQTMISENRELLDLLIEHKSFDPILEALLEDDANPHRFRQIQRICTIMTAHECMTEFAKIVLGLAHLHYKHFETATRHIQAISSDGHIHPRIVSQVGVYRALRKQELAALFDNFAAQMISVSKTGRLVQPAGAALADLEQRV